MRKAIILFFWLCIFVTQILSQISTDGLVAYYPFNGNANDSTGNGNNGTLHGTTPTTDRLNLTGSAIYFNGSSDWISIPNKPSFDFGSSDFSISYWANRENNSTSHCVFARDGRIYTPLLIGYSEEGKEVMYSSLNGSDWYLFSIKMGAIATQNWKFYLVQRKGNTIETYQDGNLISTESMIGSLPNGTGNLQIGFVQQTLWYKGSIDDFRIYNRALTEPEIQVLFHENGWTGDINSGLVAYYPFNGDAKDESGNGNDGTVNGATLTTDRFGTLNNAYSFNGSSNYIKITKLNPIDITKINQISVSVWMNSYASTGSHQKILESSGASNDDYISFYNGNVYGTLKNITTSSGPFDNNT